MTIVVFGLYELRANDDDHYGAWSEWVKVSLGTIVVLGLNELSSADHDCCSNWTKSQGQLTVIVTVMGTKRVTVSWPWLLRW